MTPRTQPTRHGRLAGTGDAGHQERAHVRHRATPNRTPADAGPGTGDPVPVTPGTGTPVRPPVPGGRERSPKRSPTGTGRAYRCGTPPGARPPRYRQPVHPVPALDQAGSAQAAPTGEQPGSDIGARQCRRARTVTARPDEASSDVDLGLMAAGRVRHIDDSADAALGRVARRQASPRRQLCELGVHLTKWWRRTVSGRIWRGLAGAVRWGVGRVRRAVPPVRVALPPSTGRSRCVDGKRKIASLAAPVGVADTMPPATGAAGCHRYRTPSCGVPVPPEPVRALAGAGRAGTPEPVRAVTGTGWAGTGRTGAGRYRYAPPYRYR